jgi:adenosylhomocysteine nucleosidase
MNAALNYCAAVLISADAEWRTVKKLFANAIISPSPFGECFGHTLKNYHAIFFQGGWGKISAAASAQFVIDHFHPNLLINLGTCGGFEGKSDRGDVILAEKTIVYDINELMGNAEEAIQNYAIELDLSLWSDPYPIPVRRGTLVSADHDIDPAEMRVLTGQYDALAADWESGAIAWVAHRNHLPCLILRAVSDVVGKDGSDAYGNYALFEQRTAELMGRLVDSLPGWMPPVL